MATDNPTAADRAQVVMAMEQARAAWREAGRKGKASVRQARANARERADR
jgi:hypothetical protein